MGPADMSENTDTQEHRQADPIAVACPHCRAEPGNQCKQIRGEVGRQHASRIAAARSAGAIKAPAVEVVDGRWRCSGCGTRTNNTGRCKGYCFDATGNSCDGLACPGCGRFHWWSFCPASHAPIVSAQPKRTHLCLREVYRPSEHVIICLDCGRRRAPSFRKWERGAEAERGDGTSLFAEQEREKVAKP